MLMMMAGMTPTPYERRLEREQRLINRVARDMQQRLTLMEMAQRRERGEDGAKPMPFARDTPDASS